MFETEKEELSFYRSLLSKMNAAVYIINLNPYEIKWVTDNDVLKTVLGMSQEEVIDKGKSIAGKVLQTPDFQESISQAVEAFNNKKKSTWTGAYRIYKEGTSELSWVMYSTATFEKDPEGYPKTAVGVAFSLHDFNTPGAMQEFITHLKSKIFVTQRASLTSQQNLVMTKILTNKSSVQIANELSLSKYTIKDHRRAIYKKLGCKNKAELFQAAQRLGLVN